MAAHNSDSPHTHFGRQMRKERLARGLTLRELSARTGINYSHLSAIETGRRPPSERVAVKMDEAFPERDGYFLEYYQESKSWMPPGFRDWGEYEDRAQELTIWVPNVLDGTVQTEDYARVTLSLHPGATDEVVAARLANRMARQRRLLRDDGPRFVLLVDQVALYRAAGSAEIMAAQMRHLAEIAARPRVTVQVVPPVTHPLATAVAIITDEAAYTENALGGSVFTSEDSVARVRDLVGIVRSEARPASESLAMIREADRRWTGVNQRSAATGARRASKRPRGKA